MINWIKASVLLSCIILLGCSKTTFNGYNLTDFNHISSTRKVWSITIDTRSKEDFDAGHLSHAYNIPFTEHFLNNISTLLDSKNSPKKLLLYIYADTKEITQNQLNEIKQGLDFYSKYSFISINYLTEDFKYPID